MQWPLAQLVLCYADVSAKPLASAGWQAQWLPSAEHQTWAVVVELHRLAWPLQHRTALRQAQTRALVLV